MWRPPCRCVRPRAWWTRLQMRLSNRERKFKTCSRNMLQVGPCPPDPKLRSFCSNTQPPEGCFRTQSLFEQAKQLLHVGPKLHVCAVTNIVHISMYADGTVNETDAQAAAVQESPNKWLALLEYLLDPDALKAFMSANCHQQVINPGSLGYGTAAIFLQRDGVALPAKQPVQICTDNAEKWQTFHQYAYMHPLSCILYIAGRLISSCGCLSICSNTFNLVSTSHACLAMPPSCISTPAYHQSFSPRTQRINCSPVVRMHVPVEREDEAATVEGLRL